ncbi:hypothetical protein Afil01_40370 [Actinorhabdospora filicis]|uniref:Uncharacterized protein n=1 Tax=Actinorhabdospora filicis TaxID=1785913 RepID=A0A9W6SNQ4_9ACTN|nr:hypothetical protein [Actinorhabdospora filicis]GLZ79230.1 hypothetical protein Afil01_40370 [Actinorhabdospora filicis]
MNQPISHRLSRVVLLLAVLLPLAAGAGALARSGVPATVWEWCVRFVAAVHSHAPFS